VVEATSIELTPKPVTCSQLSQCNLFSENKVHQSVQVAPPQEKKKAFFAQATQVDPVEEQKKVLLSNQSTQSDHAVVVSSSTQFERTILRTAACDNLAQDLDYLRLIGQVKSVEEEETEVKSQQHLSSQNESLQGQVDLLQRENAAFTEKVTFFKLKFYAERNN